MAEQCCKNWQMLPKWIFVIESIHCPTSSLDKGFSCICGYIWYNYQECLNVVTRTRWFRLVSYATSKQNKAKHNYSTMEWEALRMNYSIKKLSHYYLGNKFTFHEDHLPHLYLINKTELTGKLPRWMLAFSRVQVCNFPYPWHIPCRRLLKQARNRFCCNGLL